MNRRTFILSTAAVVATSASATARGGRAMSDAARFAAARRFVSLPAGRIAYVDRGRGPAALFLHGFPVNGFQWRGALESLAAHRRCIAPDFMGLGYSEPKPGQDLRAPAQLEMLLNLLDKLGVAAVDLVANDSGCAVAQLFLAHHPERVRTLLLTNGDTEPDCPPAALEGVVKAATAGTFASGFRPCLTDKDACRRPGQLGGDTFTFPARLRDDTIDTYLAPLLAHPERTNAFGRTFDENTLAGTSKLLSAVRAPVRILWGTGDTIFKQSSADYLDQALPELARRPSHRRS